jgi:hypothetical protein
MLPALWFMSPAASSTVRSASLACRSVVAAPGGQALAQGQYAWHVTWQGHQALAIKAGESLYVVGKLAVWDRDMVLTLHRP